MDSTLKEKFNFRIVTTKQEREKLAHITSYAFIPSPNDLERPKKGYEANKASFIQAVYPIGSETPIATAANAPMTQNIRGKVFKMGGVEAVATQPEFRKSGVVRKMMKNILEHSNEVGEVVSTLYPFKESFYAQFGYVSLPQQKIATIELRNLTQASKLQPTGRVEHQLLMDAFDQWYDFTVDVQKQIHGMSLKSKDVTGFYSSNNPKFVAFAYEDDEITGAFVYNTEGHSQGLNIRYFIYKNSNAKYLLLEFLARHIDQFSEVTLPVLPFEQPELWVNDTRTKISTRNFSALAMARVVTVEGLEGIQVGSGSLNIKIIDDQCPWNDGIFNFKSIEGKLKINKLNDEKMSIDFTLTITGLSALIYGCYRVQDLLVKKWIITSKESTEWFQKLSFLFPMNLPYMHEDF